MVVASLNKKPIADDVTIGNHIWLDSIHISEHIWLTRDKTCLKIEKKMISTS